MKVTWQQPPARGLGPTVLVETEGTASRFVLKPHKENIYLLEDVRLAQELAPAAREAVWEGWTGSPEKLPANGGQLLFGRAAIFRGGGAVVLDFFLG